MLTAEQGRRPALEYIPFDIPEGIEEIRLAYSVDPGSVVDLGLVDPGIGPFPAREGFRGWSGGARSSIFVSRHAATPGYIAGPIPAGRWHVVLGLADVHTSGCRYSIEITLSSKSEVGSRTPSSDAYVVPAADSVSESGVRSSGTPFAPEDTEPRWLRGDLQAHTYHSDAPGSLEDLVAAATNRKLDFIAVTDHNTCSQNQFVHQWTDPILIPAEELTTYFGHANVWGIPDWIDFRVSDTSDMTRIADEVHERGGLISVNHPKKIPNCIGCDWEFEFPPTFDCVEVWQGPWFYRNWESLERYDRHLRAGHRATLVGGSDRHQPGWPDHDPLPLQVGSPTTYIRATSETVSGILDALRSGAVCVSESPGGPTVTISFLTRRGDTIEMGQVGSEADGTLVVHVDDAAAGDTVRVVSASGIEGETRVSGAGEILEFGFSALSEASSKTSSKLYLRAELLCGAPKQARLDFMDAIGRDASQELKPFLEESETYPVVRALSNPVYLSG